MKNKTLLLLFTTLCFFSAAKAQLNVGSASAPDASAILQATSTTKGFLPPAMTGAQRDAIVNPATGLLVFNTTTLMVEVNKGTSTIPVWNPAGSATLYNGDGTLSSARTVTQGANSLSFNGTGGLNLNAGTINVSASALTGTGASIGTVVGLGVRADGGLNIGQNSVGQNIYLGYQAGQANTSGANNMFIGTNSGMLNTTGNTNQFIGFSSGLSNTTGFNNQFTGYNSGRNNTTGAYNNFCGTLSGQSNTSGSYNNFVGFQSGQSNTSGSYNNFVGFQSGTNNTLGSNNCFSGYNSGQYNTTGNYNTFSGAFSGPNNTTGNNNTFSGYASGLNNTIGSGNNFSGFYSGSNNTTGLNNTFNGAQSGQGNTTGNNNNFSGANSGRNNTTGVNNTFIGALSGQYNNTGNYNSFSGTQSGQNNTIGNYNTFSGVQSGWQNSSGNNNNFSGANSGQNNTTGSSNQFSGYQSGLINTTGSGNTFSGYQSGGANTTGNYNTGFGYQAGPASDGATPGAYENTTAIGYGVQVNVSNKVRLGNPNVTVIEGQVAFSTVSDARFKYNVQPNVPGIAFIKKLHPVTYQFDTKKMDQFIKNGVLNAGFNVDEKAPIQTGFLAQDVEKAAKELGIVFDGVHVPANDRDNYSVAYSQFVMPLVKAVQEQQVQIENLVAQNKKMSLQLAELKDTKLALAEMQRELNKIMALKAATQNK